MSAVLYVTRMVPHYREAALTRLNARLGGQLIVCAGTPARALASLAGSEARGYQEFPMRNVWIGGERLHLQPFGRLFKQHPHPSAVIVEESVRSVTLPLLLRRARLAGAARLIWGHFSSNRRPFSVRSPMTRYRLALAQHVDACICYTEPVADLLRPHVDAARIFVAPNTLDTGALLALHKQLAHEGRRAVRRRLGLSPDAPVAAFLGRLIKPKGTAPLMAAFALLRQRHPGAELLIIGDGPERAALEAQGARLGGVRLLGALTSWSASAPYLYAADVLLNPGYLGLAINHAFALGLPVVSQASPHPHIRYHSPEIAYLRPDRNGLLTPYGDPAALADAVEQVWQEHARFANSALAFAQQHLSLDAMVDGLVQAVCFAQSRRA